MCFLKPKSPRKSKYIDQKRDSQCVASWYLPFIYIYVYYRAEHVCETTNLEMEQDHHEISNASGGKIDIRWKMQKSPLELVCNEWISPQWRPLLVKHQSKNIRKNCALLRNLYIITKGKVGKTMAFEFIGKSETWFLLYIYIYEIWLTHNVFLSFF